MTVSTFRLIAKGVISVSMIAALVACGDPKYKAPPIVVTFASPPPASLDTGTGVGLTAVVTNDTNGSGNVTWSCIPGEPSGQCGSFTPATIHTEVPTCYLAPANVPPGGTVTVTATSVTDPSKSIAATINIVSGAPTPCP
jgi:hypothetical protein